MKLKTKLKNHPKTSIFCLIFILLFIGSCKKELTFQNNPETSELKIWYENNMATFKKPGNIFSDLKPNFETSYNLTNDSVTEFNITDPNKFAITTGAINDATKEKVKANTKIKLILFNKNNIIDGAYMAFIGNGGENMNSLHYKNFGNFTGLLMFYNLHGGFENGYKIEQGKIERAITKPSTNSNELISIADPLATKIAKENVSKGEKIMLYQPDANCSLESYDVYAETCVSVAGHPEYGSHCSYEVLYSYDVINCPSNSGGGGYYPGSEVGGGSGGNGGNTNTLTAENIANAIPFDNGKPKIQDIKKYTKCFTDGKQAKSFKMTIYVDQPVKGKGDWYKIIADPHVKTNNPYNVPTGIVWQRTSDGTFFDVGHTFVTFEKNNTDGTSVKQTLGFYPKGNSINSEGAIQDNSGHVADVSYTINVTQAQFEAGIQKVETDFATKRYVLFGIGEYNCADAAISWMNEAGAGFSNSSFGLFNNTPGTFGQDLRKKQGANLDPEFGAGSKGPCN